MKNCASEQFQINSAAFCGLEQSKFNERCGQRQRLRGTLAQNDENQLFAFFFTGLRRRRGSDLNLRFRENRFLPTHHSLVQIIRLEFICRFSLGVGTYAQCKRYVISYVLRVGCTAQNVLLKAYLRWLAYKNVLDNFYLLLAVHDLEGLAAKATLERTHVSSKLAAKYLNCFSVFSGEKRSKQRRVWCCVMSLSSVHRHRMWSKTAVCICGNRKRCVLHGCWLQVFLRA